MESSQKNTTKRRSVVCVDDSGFSQPSGRKRKRQATEEDPMWNTALDKRLREVFGPCSESTEPEKCEHLGCHLSGRISSPEHHREKRKSYGGGSSGNSDNSYASEKSATSKEARHADAKNVVEAVLFPYYFDDIITKDEYEDISRRAIPKIAKDEDIYIDRPAIESFIKQYVSTVLSERRTKLMNTFISFCLNDPGIVSSLNSASTSK